MLQTVEKMASKRNLGCHFLMRDKNKATAAIAGFGVGGFVFCFLFDIANFFKSCM